MKAFVRAVHEVEHHNVVRFGIFGDEFLDKVLQEWTKQAFKPLEEATESDMVEVIAEASF
jgi:hypothetical protein